VIACRLLGPAHLLVDGEPAPPELMWRKNLALLVYLARSPKRARARDHLIGLLWADKSESAARHSLREAIRVLRRHLGESGVDASGDQVALAADAVTLDVDRFAELASGGDWTAAAGMVAGEFLEGFSVPDASGFEDWLHAERLAWRGRSVEAMARCAEERLQSGDVTAATELGLKAIGLDPLSELAVRAGMRSLAVGGDRVGALACYQTFLDRLKETTGAEPTGELAALAERVRRERSWRVPDYLTAKPAVGAESRRAPLIGREGQLGELLRVWAEVGSRRRAAVVIVAGDPGLGKTRLLEEVLARVRLEGAAVAAVAAVPADREQVHGGLLGLARGGLLDAAGVTAAQPAALAALWRPSCRSGPTALARWRAERRRSRWSAR
jgi:DNA-binding SARP family transcriptional activator